MSDPAVRIDMARLSDVPAMVQLLRELFTLEQDFHVDVQRQERGLRLVLQHPDRAVILVARDASEAVIGMVSAQLVISTAEGAPSAWVEDMIIQAPHRGRGLGRMLLQGVFDWAGRHGATRAQLLVDLDNTPAIRFYDHLGWQVTRLGARRVILGPPPKP